MKRIVIIAIFALLALLTISEAGQVRGYKRKDGTYVSGYKTGAERAHDEAIGAIVTGAILIVGVLWWLASASSNNNNPKEDARLAQRRAQEGVLREQVRRAQAELEAKKNDPIERGLSRGEQATLLKSTNVSHKCHPFQPLPLEPSTIFNRHPSQNAFTELNNALAASNSVREVTLDCIAQINAKYKTDLHKTCAKRMEVMYKEFLAFCLADRQFSKQELDDLWHLKTLYAISDNTHNIIFADVGKEIYRRGIGEVVADGQITDEEKQWLDKLASDLELTEETKKNVYKAEIQKVLEAKLNNAVADRQWSPDEERELNELAKRLDANLTINSASIAQLDRFRLMWRLAHGDPPTISVGINLQKSEVCYFTTNVTWHEMRRVTKRVQWGGPQLRVKICKGVYWKMGDYAVNPITRDQLIQIDSGTVYVTNKRLLFTGTMKNASIRLAKILDFTPYNDGVLIEKDAGRSPVLGFSNNIDLFCASLARAIQDAG